MAIDEKEKVRAQKLAAEMERLIKSAEDERGEWEAVTSEAYGFYMGDRSVIFGSDAQSVKNRSRGQGSNPNARSEYHIPMVSEKVETAAATINGGDIEFRLVPKLDQEILPYNGKQYTASEIARMGNAGFEACRMLIGWNEHMHLMAKETLIFDKSYIAPYINYVKIYPDTLTDLQRFHAWQLFHTPGVRFADAREFVTITWVDKGDLQAEYPEFAEEIEELKVSADYHKEQDGSDQNARGQGVVNILSSSSPRYGRQEYKIFDNAVKVLERWKFAPQLVVYPTQKDDEAIDAERMAIERFITDGFPPDLETYFEDRQYHDEHRLDHLEYIAKLKERATAMRTMEVPDGYGTMMTVQQPVEPIDVRSRLNQAQQFLLEHVEMHEQALEEIPEAKIGKYEKYEGGWRQTCILGDEIIAYDGASKYYTDYGICGCPFEEFAMSGHPLHHFGGSFASALVDLNRIANGFLNAAIDNARLFGGHGIWVNQKTKDNSDEFHWNNDPNEPNTVPDDAIPGKDFGFIDAKDIPSSAIQMLSLALGLANDASAVHPTLQGKQDSGVRSGVQTQMLANLGQAQFTYKLTRLKPALERLATKWFKMVLVNPPPDNMLQSVLDGKNVVVDFELLKSVDFTIEVVVNPGGTSALEDKNMLVQAFIQNLMAIPAINASPQGLSMVFRFLAESIKNTMPDISVALKNFTQQMAQMPPAPPTPQQSGAV